MSTSMVLTAFWVLAACVTSLLRRRRRLLPAALLLAAAPFVLTRIAQDHGVLWAGIAGLALALAALEALWAWRRSRRIELHQNRALR